MINQQSIQTRKVVLEVKDLKVSFHTYAGIVKALDGVDIELLEHEVFGLVGESGCGKSVTSLAIAGLLPGNATIEHGQVILEGRDLLKESKNQIRSERLHAIALVFQDPATYLNPVITIGSQITEIFEGNLKFFKEELVNSRLESIGKMLTSSTDTSKRFELEKERQELLEIKNGKRLTKRMGKKLAKLLAIENIKLVRLPEAEKILKMYPFELSGGMRQRAMIAMALVRQPKVLLADEITTALDVTVQAQILELLKELRDKINSSIILITHDLGVVAETCDRVAVMYAGNIVEVAPVSDIFKEPLHPYTKGLFEAIPKLDTSKNELQSIKGSVPNLIFPPSGCRFHPRCPYAFERCPKEKPPLVEARPGHKVACLLFGN
ncbi:MAG: ABC transporter ATP-binding protein [Nitrososphaerota archaeon]|nr:ABC transporter ATP-binding protein [Nitrososphaerota archaeon]